MTISRLWNTISPIFEKIIIDIKTGIGFNPMAAHNRNETGPTSMRVVTLSRIADKIAVNKHKEVISGHILPFVSYKI